MADTPRADVRIDTDLVRELLREQHPDLATLPLRPETDGWDNATLRLGDHLAVRLPRRRLSADLVRHEQRWLPSIAALVPCPVPAPVRVGRPTSSFPWAWSVVPWFEGVSALSLDGRSRGAAARPLATFLAALHTPAPAGAPENPYRGVPLTHRDGDVRRRLDAGVVPRARDLTQVWEAACAAPVADGPPRWLHGDLHPGNLVLDTAAPHELRAVIDFGDVCAGDPATDLATAWLTFDRSARDEFRSVVTELCDTSRATWRRAAGWAVVVASALVESSDDHAAYRRLGLAAIDAVLDDAPQLFP
ncbi:aminoglycoside phosphotransferase family protein [Paraoerskovia marina]|uniref:aminoglycoside phosphotransferase family protein n=1 Tax=Paraoerskovia marina TaxID=545619 RepID=UPI000492D74A|nr:aminoglycoside phosphotransferase family protein [Paraoerskovia marina]